MDGKEITIDQDYRIRNFAAANIARRCTTAGRSDTLWSFRLVARNKTGFRWAANVLGRLFRSYGTTRARQTGVVVVP